MPRWEWLPIQNEKDEKGHVKQRVKLENQMKGAAFTVASDIPMDMENFETLDKHIHLVHETNQSNPPSGPLNIAVEAATSPGRGPIRWRGPIVAFCGKVSGDFNISEVQDMEFTDYRVLVAYLKFYNLENGHLIWQAYYDAKGIDRDPRREGFEGEHEYVIV